MSLAMGKLPGKTECAGILSRKDESFKLYPLPSSDFNVCSLWHYFSKVNEKVSIFNRPMLFLTSKVNRFMVRELAPSSDEEIFYIFFPKGGNKC